MEKRTRKLVGIGRKYKTCMALVLSFCMTFTMLPALAAAEETSTAPDASGAAGGTAYVCENHKQHTANGGENGDDAACGFIAAVEAHPCDHRKEDGSYSCAPVVDSGAAYVCAHEDSCGYAEGTQGAPCTHQCELCANMLRARSAATGAPQKLADDLNAVSAGTARVEADGVTVTLLKNVTLTRAITINGDLTLDTGTFTITGKPRDANNFPSYALIIDGGNVTITGSGGIVGGSSSADYDGMGYEGIKGDVTLSGNVTITGGKGTSGNGGYGVEGNVTASGDVKINGGESTNKNGGSGVRGNVTASGKVKITGGKGTSGEGGDGVYGDVTARDNVEITGGKGTRGGNGVFGGVTARDDVKITGGEGTNNFGGVGINVSFESDTVMLSGNASATGGAGGANKSGGIGIYILNNSDVTLSESASATGGVGGTNGNGGSGLHFEMGAERPITLNEKVSVAGGAGNGNGTGGHGVYSTRNDITISGNASATGGAGGANGNGGCGVLAQYDRGTVTLSENASATGGAGGTDKNGGHGVSSQSRIMLNGDASATGGVGGANGKGGYGVGGNATVSENISITGGGGGTPRQAVSGTITAGAEHVIIYGGNSAGEITNIIPSGTQNSPYRYIKTIPPTPSEALAGDLNAVSPGTARIEADGVTVTLLKDVTLTGAIIINGDLTLDTGTFTITGKPRDANSYARHALQINGGNVTITGSGGIVGGSSNSVGGDGIKGNVTLSGNVTITGGKGTSGEGGEGVMGNVTASGYVKINGGESTNRGGNGVEGNVTASGKVKITGGKGAVFGGAGVLGDVTARGDVEITGGEGYGTNGYGGIGVYGSVTASDDVTITGGKGSNVAGDGVGSDGDVIVTVTASGNVRISGGESANGNGGIALGCESVTLSGNVSVTGGNGGTWGGYGVFGNVTVSENISITGGGGGTPKQAVTGIITAGAENETIYGGDSAETVSNVIPSGTENSPYRYIKMQLASGGSSDSGGSSSGGARLIAGRSKNTSKAPAVSEIKVDGKVDANGILTVTITDKAVRAAVKKAEDMAKKNGTLKNGTMLMLKVNSNGKAVNAVNVNLPKALQQTILSKKLGNTVLVVDNPNIQVNLDLAAVTEIYKQAKADVCISVTPIGSTKLSGAAKTAIGSRPGYEIKATYQKGTKKITGLGVGFVRVTIPYALKTGEAAGGLYAAEIDANGKVSKIAGSGYDAKTKALQFTANRFSVYGIGYQAPAAQSSPSKTPKG